jgi:hypothetical protein
MTSGSNPVIIQPGRAGPQVPAGLPHRIRRFRAWSADRDSTGPRRRIQIALGLLWLLDAALQYQPYMFSPAFPTKILSASAVGSPGPVAAPVMVASRLMLHNVVAWNAVFATAQLALAAGLLCRLTVKAALAATIVWSVAVWWLGESLGGILPGQPARSAAPRERSSSTRWWRSWRGRPPAVTVSTPPWRTAAHSAPAGHGVCG